MRVYEKCLWLSGVTFVHRHTTVIGGGAWGTDYAHESKDMTMRRVVSLFAAFRPCLSSTTTKKGSTPKHQ